MILQLALIGMGIAGQARQKAAQELAGIRLAATVSRRAGLGTHTLEQVLGDPSIQAVAISTENTSHAILVEQALQAHKHVLCDYPLALSHAQALELFALAQKQGRVLHVEHIGLLAEDHQELKRQITAFGRLHKGEYLFQGGWSAKLADEGRSGPYPFHAISRLLQIMDWFGDFTVESREISLRPEGFRMHLHLELKAGGTLGFTEERIEGLPRRRSFQGSFEKGPVHWKTGSMGGNLFAKDLAWFRDRVLEGKPCYYEEGLMLKAIRILEGIDMPSTPTRP